MKSIVSSLVIKILSSECKKSVLLLNDGTGESWLIERGKFSPNIFIDIICKTFIRRFLLLSFNTSSYVNVLSIYANTSSKPNSRLRKWGDRNKLFALLLKDNFEAI